MKAIADLFAAIDELDVNCEVFEVTAEGTARTVDRHQSRFDVDFTRVLPTLH